LPEEATAIIAEARRIVTPNGIECVEKVQIGGIEQWVSVRGSERDNPALLVLHGGPGYVSMPLAWWFGRGWEEYFTVVHWPPNGLPASTPRRSNWSGSSIRPTCR
jgi:hypothetical protein